MYAAEQYGFNGDGFDYLKSPLWWCGTIMRMSSSSRTNVGKD